MTQPPGAARGTVLLTGARGLIGRATARRLADDGWRVRSFDLRDGDDLRDLAAVRDAASGCAAVVHAGALAHDTLGTPSEITATNVLGTWNVLLAAEHHGSARVVVFSSVQVFGLTYDGREPSYLPVDDDHPLRGDRPYAMSKRVNEEMCESWTARTGIPTVVLRPVTTFDDEMMVGMEPDRLEFGGFVHVDDVATAVSRALDVPVDGHVRVTLAASDDVDTSRARAVLGWEARRRRTIVHASRGQLRRVRDRVRRRAASVSARLLPTRAWRNRQTRQV